MALGCVCALLLQLGWPSLAALCLQVFARIPGRPSKEFGWGCHPQQCPPDVGWTLWCHDDFWCLKQGNLFPQAGNGRMWLSSEYACPRFRYSRRSIPVESNRSMWRRWSRITSMRALLLSIGDCWPTRSMVEILSPILNCSLLPKSWKDRWKPEILCSQKPLMLVVWM